MPVTVSSNHVLRRTVSGFIRAVKTALTEDVAVPLCLKQDELENWYWEVQADGHYSPGVHVSQLYIGIEAAKYSTGGPNGRIIELTLEMLPDFGWVDPAPTNPDVCPAYYARGGRLDKEAWIKWRLTGGVFADTVLDEGDNPLEGYVVEPQAWSSVYGLAWGQDTFDLPPFDVTPEPSFGYGENSPTEEVTYDESVAYSVSISGTFDLMADWSEELGIQPTPDHIFEKYPHGLDPCGMTDRVLEYYYRPTSGLTVTITVGSKTWTRTYDASKFGTQAEYEAAFKNGFGTVHLNAEVATTWTDPGIYPANERVDMGEMVKAIVSGIPNAGSCQVSYEKDFETYDEETPPNLLYTDGQATWTPSANGGTLSLTTGNAGAAQAMRIKALSADTVYSLKATDYNGSNRAGVEVKADEFDGALTAWEWDPINTKYPNVELTTDTEGEASATVRHPGDIRGFDDSVLVQNRYYELHDTGDGARIHSASDVDWEPAFGVTNLDGVGGIDEPKFPPDEEPFFHDGRIELIGPSPRVLNALAISSPLSKRQVEFTSTSGWTVDPAGGATLSIDPGTGQLKVVVGAADCSITKDLGTASLGGARWADLLMSGGPVTVRLSDGRTWDVTPTKTEFDLATPKTGATNPADAQSSFDSLDWGAGVRQVGNLTLELKANITYYLDAICLKRKRPIKVLVFGGSFVGRAQNDPRTSDDYTLWNGQTRKALVIVDGIWAGEIKEVLHTIDGEGKWSHTHALLGDSDMFTPTGFLVATVASAAEGLETSFLKPGVYAGPQLESSVYIDAQAYGVTVRWPYNAGNLALAITKQFRGGIGVGLSDPSGVVGEGHQIRIYSGASSSGPWTLVDTIAADASGWIYSNALAQPLYGADRYYKVATTDSSSNEVSAVVEVRNRNLTVLRLLLSLSVVGLLYDQATGYLHYCTDGKLEYAE